MAKIIRYPLQLLGLINSRHKRYDDPCNRCGTMENRTRHHKKNKYGKRTGEIEILCRPCHDIADKEHQG